jgi:hypothetical protein
MSRIMVRVLSAFFLLALSGFPVAALAHEEVESGNYLLVVGWRNEPSFVGELNGLDLFIEPKGESTEAGEEHTHAEGVEGAEGTLTFAVEYGSARQTFELRPVFGEPGHYTADIIPTRAGQYTFHFGGAINGEAVEVSIEPEEVVTADQVQFPEPAPSVADFAPQLEAAQARANTAQVIAIVGVALGLVGTGLGLYGLTRKR